MKDFIEHIENKIKKNISAEKIYIKDNTEKHRKHKFFQANKLHISLEIKSAYLDKLSKIEAQRYIMKVLEDELKNKIHALEIKIL
tara:strand:+ start:199 stop:453 length:255 start_codon:yes stop_codon:yes gene_type:complete